MSVKIWTEWVLAENFIFPINDILDIARQFFVGLLKIGSIVDLPRRHENQRKARDEEADMVLLFLYSSRPRLTFKSASLISSCHFRYASKSLRFKTTSSSPLLMCFGIVAICVAIFRLYSNSKNMQP